MVVNKPKIVILGNVEDVKGTSNGQWKLKEGKNGKPDKIFLRTGSMIQIKELFDKVRGIKDAPNGITTSLKKILNSNTINLTNTSINTGIKFYSTYKSDGFKVSEDDTPIVFTSKVKPKSTDNITENLINNLKEAINFDDIKFDKSHPDYKKLTEQKRLVGDRIEKIAMTSTVFKPTDALEKDLTLQKAETKTAFNQLKSMIVGYHQIDDMIDNIDFTSADKNKDELKLMLADLNEVGVWTKRIENFSTKLDEINFIQEKEKTFLGNLWDNKR